MNVHLKNILPSRSSTPPGLVVLVFKTNLKWKKDLETIRPVLDAEMGILRWNVDRHDVDNVLRIETFTLPAPHIASLLHSAGYCCEELPD